MLEDRFQRELLSILKDIADSNRRLANYWEKVYVTPGGRLGLLDLSLFKINQKIAQSLKNANVQAQKASLRKDTPEIKQ